MASQPTRTLLLASGSPRRREILTFTGLSFEVARPDIDETPDPGEAAAQYVARLSREKSAAVERPNSLIITADTTVADGTDILGKPADAAEAIAMLRQLRGREHTVHTGITLRDSVSGESQTSVTSTTILMRSYSDDEIAAYVAAGEPFDKAGSYGIQHRGFHPVERLSGCYANVMGLPMCTLCAMLSGQGVTVPQPVPCNSTTDHCIIEALPK